MRQGLGVCPSNPSLRGEGDALRCEAAGSKKPEAYSLEYVEDFLEPRTTQMPANHSPQQNGITRTDSKMNTKGHLHEKAYDVVWRRGQTQAWR